ncbi:MAG: TrkA family potassium uptake protein, partial [Kiritimatiellae bacterium]|nr:TrkA family potassium uptake protein [Kiritimatiellia bacterium]
GATVVKLDIRAKTGASVVGVERDGERIANIGPDFEFRGGDVVLAMGEGPQIAALKDLLEVVS